MKKKIAIIAATEMSVNAFLVSQIKALSERYDVFVITQIESGMPRLLNNAIRVNLRMTREIAPIKDAISLIQLIRILRKEKFSLVHSFTPKAGLLSAIAARFCGVRCRLHTFTGQVWATDTGVKRYVLKLIDKRIASLNTQLLVDSTSQRDYLIKNKVLRDDGKSMVLCKGSISGVDRERFKPKDETKREGPHPVVFLYMGRLKKDKGILDLAQAFKRLKEQGFSSTLMLVGEDEENMKPQVKEILAHYPDSLEILPHSENPESTLVLSDILCIPSYREGFGTVVIEAAACGIPAIGSNIYGLKDAIVDNETGLLFPVGDIDQLFHAMRSLAENKKLRETLGKNALERASRDFSHEEIEAAWLGLYETLI
jgi:glycosyltransferase involved in cell wall biosynthesis